MASFDLTQKGWLFNATPCAHLVNSKQLPVPRDGSVAKTDSIPTHDAPYWAERIRECDFSREDNLKNPGKFNRIAWAGLKGDVPYPTARSGADLRKHRQHSLEAAGVLAPAESPLTPKSAATR